MGLILCTGGCLIGAARILTLKLAGSDFHQRVHSNVDLHNVAYRALEAYRDESKREANRTYEDVEQNWILSSSFPNAMHTREI